MPKFLLGGDGRWHPYRKRSADERHLNSQDGSP